MRIHLHRIRQTDAMTLGQLVVGDLALCTVERPWARNARSVSCVPVGFYHLVRHHTERHPDTWALVGDTVSHYPEEGVQRFACLFHAANRADQVEGCIAPGLEFTADGVAESRQAMDELRRRLAFGEPHYLTITRHTGGGE